MWPQPGISKAHMQSYLLAAPQVKLLVEEGAASLDSTDRLRLGPHDVHSACPCITGMLQDGSCSIPATT